MATCTLGICDGSGFLYDEESNTARDCSCRPQIIARNHAVRLSAVVPSRYRDVAFDRYPITEIDPPNTVMSVRRFVARIDSRLDAGDGLWFIGGVGTGKTALAMVVTKAALSAGRSAARYTLPDLLRHIRRTFNDSSHDDLLEHLVSIDLLHIDDIGAQQTTPWVLEELYCIINARYEEQRSIIVTTSVVDRGALSEQITERTVSRLTEMCEELPVLGPDRRADSGIDWSAVATEGNPAPPEPKIQRLEHELPLTDQPG